MRLRIEVFVEQDGDKATWRLVNIRQGVSWEITDWVEELIACGCLNGAQGRMPDGERKRLRLNVWLWSSKYWTDCGYEYDSGIEVISRRTVARCRSRIAACR